MGAPNPLQNASILISNRGWGDANQSFFFANLRRTSLGGWAGKFSEATFSVQNRTNSIRQFENFVFEASVDVHGVENDTEQLTSAGSTFTTGNM